MASIKTTFKIEGLKELDEALVGLAEEFSPRNARNVLRSALRDGGELIAVAGAANAPYDPKDTKGPHLKDTYTVSGKLTRSQRKNLSKESDIEVYVGPTPHPKSVQTEFGNSHQAAHPHLRPAWDSNWRRVLDLVIARTAERLEQTRARLVKRNTTV